MLHCSHCLSHCQVDRLDDFVCCSGCGKILGQFFGGKYIDHGKPIFDTACISRKRKKDEKKKKKKQYGSGKIGMNSTDPQLTT